MAQVPIEELLKQCGSIYKLVILAAKRAKELADGSPSLVETPHRKITTIALEEIAQGKVAYKIEEEEDVKKKKGEKKKRG